MRDVRADRDCGKCRACCVEISVYERVPEPHALTILKPPRQPCEYLCDSGCALYHEPRRPYGCRTFHCAWRDGWFGRQLRPDHSGVLVHITPDDLVGAGLGPGLYAHVWLCKKDVSVVLLRGVLRQIELKCAQIELLSGWMLARHYDRHPSLAWHKRVGLLPLNPELTEQSAPTVVDKGPDAELFKDAFGDDVPTGHADWRDVIEGACAAGRIEPEMQKALRSLDRAFRGVPDLQVQPARKERGR